MAVEARHLNLFPSHLVANNREMMISVNEGNHQQTVYNNASIGYGAPAPLSGITTDNLHPIYNSVIADSLPPVTSDSGLTYNHLPGSRKRSRDSVNPLIGYSFQPNNNNRCGSFTFLGEDISLQIQQQQLEIEHFISQHTEKVKMEIEERRKRYTTRIFAAVEQGIMKKLKSRDEEIDKYGRLNWALEEKVKSLCIENQIWRDLAHANEATANALRSNLEHVLTEVRNQQLINRRYDGAGTVENDAELDDAQSCCGSNGVAGDDDERRTAPVSNFPAGGGDRMCRNCGRDEASVLLLPCRHLCLCNVCGSSVHICPICKSTKNASVHINLS
ncbi:probable BOI-related E3 ubiquitin-protein ligase 3 [Impatiens glandulifera]|uniref:probable BOI-related E3 ubiquitin-protein ligase 3 n=1 Tax=Impatiens glandulifera TaxID=253017 RepID=UPI001FB0D345|nr:probable BOI-related E3 ubiquitin-protein ligase 3 [Impatiens glandulifera]